MKPAPKKEAMTAEEVDAEVDALLAKIPDKYRKRLEEDKKKQKAVSLWRCEPSTVIVGSLLVTLLAILVTLSMSSKPVWAYKELSGTWAVEPQGSASRKKVANALDEPVVLTCAKPEIIQLSNSSSSISDEDKLVGDLLETYCEFTLDAFQLRTTVVLTTARVQGNMWTWTGPCTASPPLSEDICSLTLHRKRVLFSVYTRDGVFSYLLLRADDVDGARRRESWATFWNDKGRFLFAVFVVVIVLKGFQRILSGPNASEASRLAIMQRRMQRQAAAVQQRTATQ